MAERYLPPMQPYHPATFLERGVVVPFTTPLLSGTRARQREKGGLELVMPNPSGGAGVYIMPWSGISSLCCPTFHDRQLHERIAELTAVTPAVIRRVARDLAAEGLAGEDALEAAQRATECDKVDRLTANFLLLMALVTQTDLAPGSDNTSGPLDRAETQRRAKVAIRSIAPQIKRSTDWVASTLEAISDTMALIGINADNTTTRLSRVVEQLRRCATSVAEWSKGQPSEDQASYADMICAVAQCTLTIADSTLAQARGLMTDVAGLLRSWAVDPEPIIRIAGRPDWLLDGWEQICLLWEIATDDATRRTALVEMAFLVPVLPKEAEEWCKLAIEKKTAMQSRRMIPMNEDWRTGATVFNLIARNEHMRALAC